MSCLKCGRETEAGNVFCEDCLKLMAAHPVKPGTRVTIPKRPKPEPVQHPAPKVQTPEEIIAKLRRRIRVLMTLIIVLLVSLAVSIAIIAHNYDGTELDGFGIGQNYSTEAPDDVDHGR